MLIVVLKLRYKKTIYANFLKGESNTIVRN